MARLPEHLRKSLTWDRGKELTDHRRFSLATDIDVGPALLAIMIWSGCDDPFAGFLLPVPDEPEEEHYCTTRPSRRR